MKRILMMTLLSLLMTASSTIAAEVATHDVERPDIPSFVGYAPNRIVVKFDSSIMRMMDKGTLAHGKTGIATLDQVGTRHGVVSIRPQFPGAQKKTYKGRLIDLTGWHKVKFTGKVDVLDVVERYKKIPGVIDAQPVSIHTVYPSKKPKKNADQTAGQPMVPNDEFYYLQWHLPRIQAPEAWDIETGNSNIVVAILDTGVRYFHKDLGGAYASLYDPTAVDGNMWINPNETLNGEDSDGNGYVDDWIGWDFVENTNALFFQCLSNDGEDCSVKDNDPRDFNGHGTHCAGSVGAINNNSAAVASVAGGWGNGGLESSGNGAKVMPLRIGWSAFYVLWGEEVGVVAMDAAAEAFYYAADNGAKIASCSWGSSNTGGLGAAMDYFLASGGLIFKAAGNDGDATADYMGGRDDVISVAATDESDCKAYFSTYGDWVDISAPGVNILSLFHDHTDPVIDHERSLNGTSMAAPLAASVAALIWSLDPGLSAEQVKQRLYLSADPIDGLTCNSTYAGKLGAGRINAYLAVNLGPIADFTADSTCGEGSLSVTFTDESTGTVTGWSWDFGDGSTSPEQNPTHTYTDPGTYTVSLTVTGPEGSDDEIKTDFITVNEPGPAPSMEVGEITNLDHNWKRVNFTRCFNDPVVVAKPLSYNGTQPAVVRMSNVDGSGFEIRIQEWEYLDGEHNTVETVSYLVMERGSYALENGTQVEAGSLVTDQTSSFTTVSFSEPFQGGLVPVVVAAVGSFNGTHTVTNRLRNISTAGFEFRMQEQEIDDQDHQPETIYYFAWQPGYGTVSGLDFEVATTTDEVTEQFYPIWFDRTFPEAPMFLADMQTTDDEDPAAVRWQNRDLYGVEVKVEEEQSGDEETGHTTEVVGYVAFGLTEPPVAPVADFSGAPTSGEAPLSVTFTDESTGTVTGWSWDFGDGSTSPEQNPTHTYTDPGTYYTVSLTVTGPEGSDDEIKTDFITVNEPGPGPSMEVGEITNLDHNWKRVNFTRYFLDPVVVAKPLSYNGTQPAVVRMSNVDGSGFEIRIQEWKYLDGEHNTVETVSYLVMERGSYALENGTQVEAGSFVTDQTSSFTTVSFSEPFQGGLVPVVVAAVGSFNGTHTVTNRLRNISTAGFEFRMQEQEIDDQDHQPETIYYFAWQPGYGTVSGLDFEVATTTDEVTEQFYPISFDRTFLEAPMFLADMQTTDGEDPAAVRWQNRDLYGVEVKVEEEQSRDGETRHTTEVVGYMAFSVEN